MQLDDILERQQRSWNDGEPISVERLLSETPAFNDQSAAIVDLIYAEVLLREERGEHPSKEEYVSRFPKLSDSIERQFQVHRALKGAGEAEILTDAGGETLEESSSSNRTVTFALNPPAVPGFELKELLGKGGSGVAWRARDVLLDRTVAIKFLFDNFRSGETLLNEAKAAASLRHENIVPVYQIGETSGFPFFVMECFEGGSLASRLAAGPMLPKDAAVIAKAISRAVYHAHQNGIIHRDLKPGNILLDNDSQPHVADFGLAKQLDPEETHQTTGVVGTPAYMAPEQARGAPATEEADVYSVGATLYEMLTGRPPFQTASVWDTLFQVMQNDAVPARQLNDRVPQDLETICAKCLEKKPERRYESANELAEELQRFLDGKPIQARPISKFELFRRWCGSNSALAGALLTVAALVTTLAVGSVFTAIYFKNQNGKLAAAVRGSIDAADELLVSVTEDAQLLPKSPGTQEVSRRLLEKAQSYYTAFLDQYEGDPELTFQLARTHAGLARVAAAFEDSEKLAAETNAALEMLDEIESESPTFESQLLRGRLNNVLGAALQEELKSEEAKAFLVNAITAYEGALGFRSDDTEATLQLCKAKLGLGVVSRSLGDMEQAETNLADGRVLLKEVLELNPGMPKAVMMAARAESNLAILKGGKDMSALQAHLEKSMEFISSLPEEYHDSVEVRLMRMKNCLNRGYGFTRTGELKNASRFYELGIAEAKRLVELEPAIVSHKRNYVIAVMNSGGSDVQSGSYQRVADNIREVLPVNDRLIEDDPDNAGNLELKGMLLGNLSVALRNLEQYDEALDAVRQSVETAELVAAATGRTPESQYTLALCFYQKAQLLIEMGRIDDALVAVEGSRKATIVGLAKDPNDTALSVQIVDLYVVEIEALAERDPEPTERIIQLATEGAAKAQQLRTEHENYYLDVAWGILTLTLGDESFESGTPEQSLVLASKVIGEFHDDDNEPEADEMKVVLADAYCLKARCLTKRKGTPQEEDADADLIRISIDTARLLGATEEQLSSL